VQYCGPINITLLETGRYDKQHGRKMMGRWVDKNYPFKNEGTVKDKGANLIEV
jgi:hypothetical protein